MQLSWFGGLFFNLTKEHENISTHIYSDFTELRHVNNANQELKSGMYANVSFNLQRNEPSFVVPYSAVVTNQERSFVIRVRDGKTEWMDVRSGISMKDHIEIFGNLEAADKLVLKANDELKPGTSIITR